MVFHVLHNYIFSEQVIPGFAAGERRRAAECGLAACFSTETVTEAHIRRCKKTVDTAGAEL
jgi:hypothetical protein